MTAPWVAWAIGLAVVIVAMLALLVVPAEIDRRRRQREDAERDEADRDDADRAKLNPVVRLSEARKEHKA